MGEILKDQNLIAYCGLYCGSCKRYLNGKCPSCAKNTKATWCKTRTCNIGKNYKSCADCSIENLRDCKINDNFVAKVFGVIFNSDRIAGQEYIRKNGYEAFINLMVDTKQVAIKRKK